MKNEAIKEVFHELFSHLERLEAQNDEIIQLLKEKKRVTDKVFAPYLEQAAKASDVRWRAARVRIDHLLASTGDEEMDTTEKRVEDKIEKKPKIADEKQAAPAPEKRPGEATAKTVEPAPNEKAGNEQKSGQKAVDDTAQVAASDDRPRTQVTSHPAPATNKPKAANDGRPAATPETTDSKPVAVEPVGAKSGPAEQGSAPTAPESNPGKKPHDSKAA